MVGGQQLGVASQLLNSRPNNGLFLFTNLYFVTYSWIKYLLSRFTIKGLCEYENIMFSESQSPLLKSLLWTEASPFNHKCGDKYSM